MRRVLQLSVPCPLLSSLDIDLDLCPPLSCNSAFSKKGSAIFFARALHCIRFMESPLIGTSASVVCILHRRRRSYAVYVVCFDEESSNRGHDKTCQSSKDRGGPAIWTDLPDSDRLEIEEAE